MRFGVGLSLVRDSIAIGEAQACGLVIADRVSLDCSLSGPWRAKTGGCVHCSARLLNGGMP